MKPEDLLNAIGGVDEDLLLEPASRAQWSARNTLRFALVAAVLLALAITASATSGLFGNHISDPEIVTGETVFPFDMDSEGNIIPEGIQGQKVCMKVELDEDAPDELKEIYHIAPSSEWDRFSGGGSSIISDGINHWHDHSITWTHVENSGYLRFTQSDTTRYRRGFYGENCVGRLLYLPAVANVTEEVTTIAGIHLLKVTIPPVDAVTAKKGPYCPEGETRLYWSDGRYILELDCPAWMTDSQIEELLYSISVVPYVIGGYPDNWYGYPYVKDPS